MEKPTRFSEYLFAKMAPGGGVEAAGAGTAVKSDTAVAPRELTGIRRWLADNLLLLVTLSGVVLGAILGFGLLACDLSADTVMLISYPGELFMRVLKLMILPLVIASLVSGSASLNARMNGRIAVRTLLYFLTTSLFNAILGTSLALLIHPGDASDAHQAIANGNSNGRTTVNLLDSLLDLGRNIFPDNIFQAAFQQAHTVYVPKQTFSRNVSFGDAMTTAMTTTTSLSSTDFDSPEIVLVRQIHYRAGTNTLGIVFFCLVFGTLLGTLGQKGQVVIDFFTAIFEVVMRMVTGVMWLTPIGISSVIAGKILSVVNLSLVMSQLAWFIATVLIGVFFYQIFIMQGIYFVFLRKNPFKFYYGLVQPMLTAFATASTAAALPLTFRCMNEKLKIDPRITRFVLPIGCNINMDGTALFVSVASVFIAQMNGIHMGFGEIITVILTSTAASLSSASVPSAALVLLLIVLTAIDAPVQDVSLLFAVDWFVDRFRTTNNMLGDCYAAVVVEHLSKKELMACDAAAYQISQEHSPVISNGHILPHHRGDLGSKLMDLETVVVDMHNTRNNSIKN